MRSLKITAALMLVEPWLASRRHRQAQRAAATDTDPET